MNKIKSDYSFTALPNWIIRKQEAEPGWMDSKEIVVLFALQSFASGIGGSPVVYPSIERLAVITNLNRKTVMAAIKQLITKGILEKEARYVDGVRKTNVYRLNIWNHEPPKGLEIAETNPRATLSPMAGPSEGGGLSPLTGGSKSDERTSAGPLMGQKQYPSNNTQNQYIGETENSSKNGKQQLLLKKVLKALEPLPDNIRIESKLITEWLLKRKARHRLDPEITSRSLKALEEARKLNVLAEYCEIAAERGWSSLGFVGYADFLEKLSKEKNPTCNNTKPKQTIIKPKATLH